MVGIKWKKEENHHGQQEERRVERKDLWYKLLKLFIVMFSFWMHANQHDFSSHTVLFQVLSAFRDLFYILTGIKPLAIIPGANVSFHKWYHSRVVTGSGSCWCLTIPGISSLLSMWRRGMLFFGSKCFTQGQFPSSAQHQGMCLGNANYLNVSFGQTLLGK